MLRAKGRELQAERKARTKALGRNKFGVFKKEKEKQFCWNMVKSILGGGTDQIKLYNSFSSFLKTYT